MSYPVYTVPAGDTLPILFDTFDGGTGASITMTGLAVTDIEIYKDGGTTQRASDSGYTLLDTDGIDFDGVTGIHGFSIDTSDNTDAGFYTTGAWYHVVVSSITVDSQTVSFVAAAFRIVAAEGTAGVPAVDATYISGSSTAADNAEIVYDTDFSTNYNATRNAWVTNVQDTVGSGNLPADAVAISGSTTAADNAEIVYDTDFATNYSTANDKWQVEGSFSDNSEIATGTAQGVTATTIQLASGETFADDEIIGATVVITGGSTGVGQSRIITDYTGSTDTATVDTWTTTPTGTITYSVYATPPSSATSPVKADTVQISGSSTAANNAEVVFDTDFSTNYNATRNAWATNVQDTVGSGNLPADAVTISGSATAADNAEVVFDTDFATNYNTTNDKWQTEADVTAVSGDSGAADNLEAAFDGTGYDVGGVDVSELNQIVDDLINGGRLDLLIDAIKAKTDSLTFTQAGEVDANIQSINDAAVTGDGNTTPWDAA